MGLGTKVGTVLAKDVDELLSYKTARVVRIRDRRLCISRLVIMLAIVIYVVGVELIFRQGYMRLEPPQSTLRISIRDPASLGNTASPESSKFCAPESKEGGLFYSKLPCVDWDYHDAVFPAMEEKATFISTRVSFSSKTSTKKNSTLCIPGNLQGCGSAPVEGEKFDRFVPSVEDYTVMLVHSVLGRVSGVMYTHSQMVDQATWIGQTNTGEEIERVESNSGKDRPGDIVSISQILSMAGTTLGAASEASAGENQRFAGITVLVFVEYSSTKKGDPTYNYVVQFIPSVEFKHEQVIWSESDTTMRRTVLNRHGIRLLVVQGGLVGRASFIETLKTLVTVIALFGVAKFVVDRILLRLLSKAEVYKRYKYADSIDFSQLDVKEGEDGAGPEYRVFTHDKQRSYPLEAHDFIYGTMLRGGYEDKPEWDMGAGSVAAYQDSLHHATIIRNGQNERATRNTRPSEADSSWQNVAQNLQNKFDRSSRSSSDEKYGRENGASPLGGSSGPYQDWSGTASQHYRTSAPAPPPIRGDNIGYKGAPDAFNEETFRGAHDTFEPDHVRSHQLTGDKFTSVFRGGEERRMEAQPEIPVKFTMDHKGITPAQGQYIQATSQPSAYRSQYRSAYGDHDWERVQRDQNRLLGLPVPKMSVNDPELQTAESRLRSPSPNHLPAIEPITRDRFSPVADHRQPTRQPQDGGTGYFGLTPLTGGGGVAAPAVVPLSSNGLFDVPVR